MLVCCNIVAVQSINPVLCWLLSVLLPAVCLCTLQEKRRRRREKGHVRPWKLKHLNMEVDEEQVGGLCYFVCWHMVCRSHTAESPMWHTACANIVSTHC